MQFLRAGRVRLTFNDPETYSTVLKDGLDLGDVTVQLFPAHDRVRLVLVKLITIMFPRFSHLMVKFFPLTIAISNSTHLCVTVTG